MPNVNKVLGEEIRRLARKEVREQTGTLKKTVTELRTSVAALKRENARQQRRLAFLERREKGRLEEEPEAEAAEAVRFSPKWVAADRKRLGLSAKDYGQLVGVSHVTVYNWENGKSKPRAKQLAAWADVRGIGKREANRRLELLER